MSAAVGAHKQEVFPSDCDRSQGTGARRRCTHAIANATGVWIKDLPITPEKIVDALKQKKAADAARREEQAELIAAK